MNMRIRFCGSALQPLGRSLLLMCGTVILVLATSVGGDAAASRTYLTFDGPVGLPGVTLASGTYLFERTGTALDLVRVTNTSNNIVYMTAFTKEVTRPPGAAPNISIVLGESPSGKPRPIKAWFPEYSLTGREFIYR
jgi:hypothetical protein